MQETKFKDAIKYYEPHVGKMTEQILDCQAIVLANLCVSYIMTSQNEEAEELMRRVEREEEEADPEKQCFHLCIINLVIGTLYCAKGNFEFGIGRVMKCLSAPRPHVPSRFLCRIPSFVTARAYLNPTPLSTALSMTTGR